MRIIGEGALALAVIAAFLLAWFGARLVRGADRKRGILMLVAAAVLVGNVLIWTV